MATSIMEKDTNFFEITSAITRFIEATENKLSETTTVEKGDNNYGS